ncbi:MAG: nucleoside triphosphate pyrophosphohydrolase [Clostridia bacterium]|nr:nucleoside triphosphate pyrophosphohydrolase [Clostridia bacterium]
MHEITVIGLGVDGNDLPASAHKIIENHELVVARTGEALSVKLLLEKYKNLTTLDGVYLKSRNFDTLSANLGKEVLTLAKERPVCYLVDGSATEDNSVKYILSKTKNVKVIAGVSHAVKCLERLGVVEPSCLAVSAYDIQTARLCAPLVVTAIDGAILASAVKLILSERFGEERDVYISSNGGVKKIKLYELDRLKNYDYSTCLYLPELALENKLRFDFDDLMEILNRLRAPNGCPWDREQTEKTILKNVVEEAYELVDAVNQEDDDMIMEETGDLILQSAFYTVFGEEGARYNRHDVLSGICSKLISRHTHVFGGDKAVEASDALSVWNKNKIKEKGYDTATDYLKAVPTSMPALMRAEKVGKRAGKYGFDFASFEDALSKLFEEVEELKLAKSLNDADNIEKECGDVILSAVNAVRLLGVDAELALSRSVDKFINRFSLVESELSNEGKNLTDLTPEELDGVYESVKQCK